MSTQIDALIDALIEQPDLIRRLNTKRLSSQDDARWGCFCVNASAGFGLPPFRRIVSVPFASFSDPLISRPEDVSILLEEIHDFAGRSRSRRIEIRSLRTVKQCAVSFHDSRTKFKHHYLDLNTTTDALYASFEKSSICQKVSKAHRSGVVVEEGFDDESPHICHSILTDTRRRLSLPPIPLRFFESMKRKCKAVQLRPDSDRPRQFT